MKQHKKAFWFVWFLCVGCLTSACSRQPQMAKAENQAVTSSSPRFDAHLIAAQASPTPMPRFQRLQVLETGAGFHGGEIKARSGQEWLGLYVTEQDSQLILSKLKIEFVKDEIMDFDTPGQKTGKSVSVDRKETPVFLLRKAPGLQAGKVVTVLSTKPNEGQVLHDRQPMKLQLGDLVYELVMTGDAPSPQKEFVPISNPRLILRQGTNKQVVLQLGQIDENAGWQLFWAGDLDGDGKLDFYADLTEHYNVSRRKLFLSSQARPGQLVREVGEFVTTGC